VRDLLRLSLVQQRAGDVLAIQNLCSRNRGRSISANAERQLTPETVAAVVADPNLALARLIGTGCWSIGMIRRAALATAMPPPRVASRACAHLNGAARYRPAATHGLRNHHRW
jgi:hypothetical protein